MGVEGEDGFRRYIHIVTQPGDSSGNEGNNHHEAVQHSLDDNK